MTEPIFTRYLYEKREAMHALLVSLLKRQMRAALFWTYELYFSGFEQETWDWTQCIYEEFYKLRNPRYERHVLSKYQEWTETRNPELIGSVIMTLSHRSSSISLYFERNGIRIPESETPLIPEKYVFLFNFLQDYATKDVPVKLADVSRFAIPKQATRYLMDNNGLELLNDGAIREAYLGPDWLYYCHETPLWAKRIQEHGGKVDLLKKRVAFPCDDSLEAFYDKYGLEPDEQSNQIHEKHGIMMDSYLPYSLDAFISYYHSTLSL
jgi:hypothetical protein